MNVNTIIKRIDQLRNLMSGYKIQAYVIPGTDSHHNEYIPALWKRREWISGFTGSNGDMVVSYRRSGLWTDSRYFIQAEIELAGTEIILHKLGFPDTKSIGEWICSELSPGDNVGIDPSLYTKDSYEELNRYCEQKNISIMCIEKNLVDQLWQHKPSFPSSRATIHPLSFCGEAYPEKIKRLRHEVLEEKCDMHVITSLDSIAWLLNIRGMDIQFNPVLIAYLIITTTKIKLFISPDSIQDDVKRYFEDEVEILPYTEFRKQLIIHAKKTKRVWVDQRRTSYDIIQLLEPFCKILYKESPVVYFKAVKNTTEIGCLKNAHIRDGVAMVKFLCWLESSIHKGKVTEQSAEKKLEYFRMENLHFQGLSFKTISAFREHGAIIHYSLSNKTDSLIRSPGLFLIDSGAQYLDGTTDITRTIAVGNPTLEQRCMFTHVLKGHINLATTKFPRGTKGIQLDTLARKFLWDLKCDYGHGTGHGVGFYLNVHEGPHAISHTSGLMVDLVPGMVCTIEPGYYKKDEYGIRIENIVIVAGEEDMSLSDNEYTPFYYFKTLTLCPIDITLIDSSLLSPLEINFINSYHLKVRKTLTPLLDDRCATWLERATIPLS